MSFYIENAEYVATIEDYQLVFRRKQNLLIEDGYIKCSGRDCYKSRDSIVIDGSFRIVLPSLINLFVDPLTVVGEHQGFTIVRKHELNALSRLTCLKHVLNGLAGFISRNHDMFFHNVCRDLKLHFAYLSSPIDSKNPYSDNGSPVFLFIDLNRDEDFENLANVSSSNGWVFIKTPSSRKKIFNVKRRTGKWLVELLSSYNLLKTRSILIGLNWISAVEINYIISEKPLFLTSPSQSMSIGEHGYLPVKPLLDNRVPVALYSGNYMTLGFNLYLEYPLFYLLTRFLYGETHIDYSRVLESTILAQSRLLGFENSSFTEGSRPTLTILKLSTNPVCLDNTTLSPMLFFEASAEYLFINGELVLNPDNRYEYFSELYSVLNELSRYKVEWDERGDL